jgi:hypothetical protein
LVSVRFLLSQAGPRLRPRLTRDPSKTLTGVENAQRKK